MYKSGLEIFYKAAVLKNILYGKIDLQLWISSWFDAKHIRTTTLREYSQDGPVRGAGSSAPAGIVQVDG